MSDRKSAGAIAADIGEAARQRAVEIGEAARAGAEAAFERARDVAEDSADEAHRFMKRQLRDRPVTVTAAAVGIGVLIGLALSNGRR